VAAAAVNVHIDKAGEECVAADISDGGVLAGGYLGADVRDALVFDEDVGVGETAVGAEDEAAAEDGAGWHVGMIAPGARRVLHARAPTFDSSVSACVEKWVLRFLRMSEWC
jgi:hypothetical protein